MNAAPVELTADSGCIKTTVQAGRGELASSQPGAKVKFQYKAAYDDGSAVDFKAPEWTDYEIRLGRSFKVEAWELCLASMREGEWARVAAAPRYGAKGFNTIQSVALKKELQELQAAEYAKEAGGSAASCQGLEQSERAERYPWLMSGGASMMGGGCACGLLSLATEEHQKRMVDTERYVLFELRLVAIEAFEVTKMEYWEMNYAQKLEATRLWKAEAEALFRTGAFEEAGDKYHKAVCFMETMLQGELEGAELDAVHELRLPLHLNVALCRLKCNDDGEAVASCDKVLEHEPHNLKALFRRGQALMHKSLHEQARADLELALRLAAEAGKEDVRANVAKQLKKLDKEEAAAEAKEKKVYAKMF